MADSFKYSIHNIVTIVSDVVLPELEPFRAPDLAGAPILSCLLSGLDRKISARMQSRFGPPLLQPPGAEASAATGQQRRHLRHAVRRLMEWCGETGRQPSLVSWSRRMDTRSRHASLVRAALAETSCSS